MAFPARLSKNIFFPLLLAVVAAVALYLARPAAYRLNWSDEMLYFGTARNIFDQHSLSSHHYLTESLIKKGYPTRDFHPPGYPILLAAAFLLGGANEWVPFAVNALLFFLTVGLIYALGARLERPLAGFWAALLYLLFPLTLPLAQSSMSETAASAAVAMIAAVVFFKKEGYLKGLLLAVAVAWAALIKPTLGALLPAAVAALFYLRSEGWRKTLATLLGASLFLLTACYLPLTAHREYYPVRILDLGLQKGLAAKAHLLLEIFRSNWSFFSQTLPQKNGQGLSSLAFFILAGWGGLSLGLLKFLKKNSPPANSESRRVNALACFTGIALLLNLLAVFFLYEYRSYRGPRSLASLVPLLALVTSVGFSRACSRWRWKNVECGPYLAALVFGIFSVFCLGWTRISHRELRAAQLRDGVFLRNASSRLMRAKNSLGLEYPRVLSQSNFYFAIENYPSEVIWSLPRSLDEFSAIIERVPVDLVEFSEKDRIILEKKQSGASMDELPGDYHLVYQDRGYYYYRRLQPKPPGR